MGLDICWTLIVIPSFLKQTWGSHSKGGSENNPALTWGVVPVVWHWVWRHRGGCCRRKILSDTKFQKKKEKRNSLFVLSPSKICNGGACLDSSVLACQPSSSPLAPHHGDSSDSCTPWWHGTAQWPWWCWHPAGQWQWQPAVPGPDYADVLREPQPPAQVARGQQPMTAGPELSQLLPWLFILEKKIAKGRYDRGV